MAAKYSAFGRVFLALVKMRDGVSGYELTAPPVYTAVESGDTWKANEDQVFFCPAHVFEKFYTFVGAI